MCYFSGLQVHVGEDRYSYPGEVMQCCKTTTQHCREAEDLCSSFNLDVAKDSVITCNQVISLSFKTWSRCLKSNENLVTVLGSTAHRRMFLDIFQKNTLDASSKGEGSDIYIYLSLVPFQAFWVTFFVAGTRQWLVPEMYFVHVQAASVHQPFQCCKLNYLNSLCFKLASKLSLQHAAFFLGFWGGNLIPDVNSLSVKVLIFQGEKIGFFYRNEGIVLLVNTITHLQIEYILCSWNKLKWKTFKLIPESLNSLYSS